MLILLLGLTVTGKLVLAAIALSSFYIWCVPAANSSRSEDRLLTDALSFPRLQAADAPVC